MSKITGIYKLISPSGKIYIGSSINITNRIKYYKSLNCKGQVKLYNSLKKYGWENHKFEILEECLFKNLYSREIYFGNLYNVLGLNGLNSILPKSLDKISVSLDTRLKMSESKKGNKNSFYNKKHTVIAKKKMSDSQIGRKHTEEHKAKVSKNSAKFNSKIVLDTSTGVFYSSAKEVSLLFDIVHSTIKQRLNGGLQNNTNFIYV